jgi:adenosine kinase
VMGSLKIASRGPQNHTPSLAEIGTLMQSTYGVTL